MDMRLQQGISLVEVLVTLLIIKLGLLGALAAQTMALQQIIDATQRTQAVALAADLVSSLQSSSAESGSYQLEQWQQKLLSDNNLSLFKPEYCLTQQGSLLTLQLSWQQRANSREIDTVSCDISAGRNGFVLSSHLGR